VGVGREKQVANSLTCTPRRKIRARFQGYKHTSLARLISESWEVRLILAHCDLRNGGRDDWKTVLL
jgi:hypothetical protein